jgi:hypothetical protein
MLKGDSGVTQGSCSMGPSGLFAVAVDSVVETTLARHNACAQRAIKPRLGWPCECEALNWSVPNASIGLSSIACEQGHVRPAECGACHCTGLDGATLVCQQCASYSGLWSPALRHLRDSVLLRSARKPTRSIVLSAKSRSRQMKLRCELVYRPSGTPCRETS